MTRKYSPEMLLHPIGRLQPSMFPGLTDEELTNVLEIYLDDGYAQAAESSNVDAAAYAWAHYRGFDARATQLAAMEASINVPGEVASTRTDSQRALFERRAAEFLAAFTDLTIVAGQTEDTLVPPSGTSRTHIGWGGTITS